MSNLGNEFAFPYEEVKERIDSNGAITKWITHKGMSKRFYAACAAMQGLLVNSIGMDYGVEPPYIMSNENIVKLSYQFADELLKQEQDGKE